MSNGFTIELLYRNHKAITPFDRPLAQVNDAEIADRVRALAARIDRTIAAAALQPKKPWPVWPR